MGCSAERNNLRDRRGAFSDSRSDPFDGAASHVSNSEDAGNAGFQMQDAAPHIRARCVRFEIRACHHEAFGVQSDFAVAYPIRRRVGTDEEKKIADRTLALLSVMLLRQATRSSRPLGEPTSFTTSVSKRSSMLGIALMRSMRYRDIDWERLLPRIGMKIFLAKPERKIAAWPAELPPPTSAISSLRHILASIGDAQYQIPRP